MLFPVEQVYTVHQVEVLITARVAAAVHLPV